MLYHIAYDADEAARSLRTGICLRWPGAPLDRAGTGDPWSFALALDYQRTHTPSRAFGGIDISGSAAWMFSEHLLVALQAEVTTAALHASGTVTPTASMTLALGVAF